MFGAMNNGTKITLSSKELDLVCNIDWILTKHAIIQKVYALFGAESMILQQLVAQELPALEAIINAYNPKIAKGENYKQLPYVMLDYPRCFEKENTLAIRTMFWWGNYFSIHLQLEGIYKAAATEKLYGHFELLKEQGYAVCISNERTGIRPTLEINGIWGGYEGEGAKTVLPSKATAKISARLVPDQSSVKITTLLLDHFKKIAPPYVTVKAFEHHGGEPYITPIDSKAYKAAARAIETTFAKKPIPVRGGGSIPICSLFEQELGIKIVFMGFGLDSDNLHSPNEKFNIENFYKGIETIPYFHKYFAE